MLASGDRLLDPEYGGRPTALCRRLSRGEAIANRVVMGKAIARCLSSGTFPNRIERLQDFLVDKYSMDIPEEIEVDPVDRVRELIEEIRNNFERLPDEQMLELLTDWVENPQSDNCCYEQLDALAETLGFDYQEVDGDCILVTPSPTSIAAKIVAQSDAEFYHSAIALAGLALPSEELSPPPSVCCAGYEFLENLAKRLSVISRDVT